LNEVQRLLTQFLNFRIGKVLRTKRFIDSVRSALVK